MSSLHFSLHLHADDTFTTQADQDGQLVRAAVWHDLVCIATTETDSFRSLAAALLEAADKAERLWAETHGVSA